MDSGILKYLLAYYCFQAPSVVRTRHVPAFVVGQLLSHVLLFATPWTAAHQASLSFTISWSLFRLMCIESVMPSSHLTLCCPLLLLNLPQHQGLHCTWNFTLSYNHLSSYKLFIAVNCCRLLHRLNICKDFWMCFHSATLQTADFNREVHKFLFSNT